MSDDVIPQSAAIPYVIENDTPRILLITSRNSGRWIVPKGVIEDWQTPEEAALEEAFEEAGVEGAIVGTAVGTYQYNKWGGTCRVDVFLLRVEKVFDAWPESKFRNRKWVATDEALEMVENVDLRGLIRRATTLIG